MTTAVASPPSLQPLSRWGNGNFAQGGLNTMSADEVSRMFQPRKSVQRIGSASSVPSSASSTSTASAPLQTNGDAPAANGEANGWGPRKKPARGLWPSSKAEPVSGITNGRPQHPSTPTTSGQSAASTISAMHQPSSVLPSQNVRQAPQPQQNGARNQAGGQGEPQAILVLLPLTGTFQRKHISVPYAPETMRIGRQTNAKTVPISTNGYFDSKVLSRQHAEVWATSEGKIMIRDVKSSNGTFVNGKRLSPENRDSEPHLLQEGDTLELGIDIVSEDQKSIVHHKVSAKVELAGVYGNGTNVIDLNSGDMDASDNGPNGQHMRGRGGSQGSQGPNGRMSAPLSVAGSNPNMMGPQRQMNLWLNPVTIEQVVKKLATELKQAKQQSQDLNRTGDFFNTLLALEPGQDPPKPPEEHRPRTDPQSNSIYPAAEMESNNPFSHPPVPPPQQPLPEKPDMAAFVLQDAVLTQPQLNRSETERPLSSNGSPLPEGPESSRVLSLVEALGTARREIDTQGDKVKHLEALLNRERKARESAEERARRLLEGQFPAEANGHLSGSVDESAFDPPSDTADDDERKLANGYLNHDRSEDGLSESSSVKSDSTLILPGDPATETAKVDASTSRLQERLDLMVREMHDMKVSMEKYKRRAEDAEEERDTLRDMIQKIRDSGALRTGKFSNKAMTPPEEATFDETITDSEGQALASTERGISGPQQYLRAIGSASNSLATMPDLQELERTVSTVLQQTQPRAQGPGGYNHIAIQSAPYASMVGVVLIGVGIMTWLNGWQRGER